MIVSKEKYDDASIAADRVENIAKELANQIRNESKANIKKKLALPDNQFLMDMIVQAMTNKAISEITIEKKRLNNRIRSRASFFDNIRKNGGLFTSSESASILGVSKVTVKKKKDENKLLALNLNGEFVYPAFQFSLDENSEKGVLKGMAEILPNLTRFSDVMRYGFFVQKRNVLDSLLPDGEEYTVVDMMKNGLSDSELESIIRLSKNFGSQDPS